MNFLINLVKTSNNEVVKEFLSKKRNSVIIEEQKKKDEEGKTALMHAAISGNLKMVKLLCQKGKIDITAFNAQDNNGMTAVMHAAKLGHHDILKFFYNIPQRLTNNADEQNFSYVAKDSLLGLNALMLAIFNRHIDCLELLYCKEIQHIINHRDNKGRTAIMLALAEIEFGNAAGSNEEVENAKSVLDELFRVVEVVFSKRDEKYLNPQFDNKFNLTIKDKDGRNIFAYAEKAKCEKELLDFIASIPMDEIIPNLSVCKLLDSKQPLKSIECSEDDLTGYLIFNQAPEILLESNIESCASSQSSTTIPLESSEESDIDIVGDKVSSKSNKRPATEINDLEQVKKRSCASSSIATEMNSTQSENGVKSMQFSMKLKKLWAGKYQNEVIQAISVRN